MDKWERLKEEIKFWGQLVETPGAITGLKIVLALMARIEKEEK